MITPTVAVSLASNALGLIADGTALVKTEELPITQKAELLSSAAMHALSIGATSSAALGCSPEVQERWNTAEKLGTMVNLPIQITALCQEMSEKNEWKWGDVTRFMEIVGGNMARLIRLESSFDVIQAEKYLAMTDEERAKVRIPVYGYVAEGSVISYKLIEERTVDKAECEQMVLDSKSRAHTAGVIEYAAQQRLLSQGLPMLAAFVWQYRQAYAQARAQQRARIVEDMAVIPREFDNDPVLKANICGITLAPIRRVVIDPTTTTGTRYERSAIEEWIGRKPESPTTRLPLTLADLRTDDELQRQIDGRLRELVAQRESLLQRMRSLLARRDQAGDEVNRSDDGAPATH